MPRREAVLCIVQISIVDDTTISVGRTTRIYTIIDPQLENKVVVLNKRNGTEININYNILLPATLVFHL